MTPILTQTKTKQKITKKKLLQKQLEINLSLLNCVKPNNQKGIKYLVVYTHTDTPLNSDQSFKHKEPD